MSEAQRSNSGQSGFWGNATALTKEPRGLRLARFAMQYGDITGRIPGEVTAAEMDFCTRIVGEGPFPRAEPPTGV